MTPTLAQVLEAAVRGRTAEIRVSLPGRIVSYDAAKQRADVQPMVSDGFEQENGERGVTRLPTLTDVPIAFQGAGDYSQTFPIAKGDIVMLHFCSSSIARWKTQGGEVDPGDDRRHQLADAVAYPGVRDFAHALSNVPSDAWVITVPSGKEIRLGSSGASDAALSTLDGADFMTALSAAIAALSGAPVSQAALTALQTALQTLAASTDPTHIGSQWPVGAHKVKVE